MTNEEIESLLALVDELKADLAVADKVNGTLARSLESARMREGRWAMWEKDICEKRDAHSALVREAAAILGDNAGRGSECWIEKKDQWLAKARR